MLYIGALIVQLTRLVDIVAQAARNQMIGF